MLGKCIWDERMELREVLEEEAIAGPSSWKPPAATKRELNHVTEEPNLFGPLDLAT